MRILGAFWTGRALTLLGVLSLSAPFGGAAPPSLAEFQWVRQAGSSQGTGPVSPGNSGNRAVIDRAGNCYVVGYFTGTATFGTTNIASAGSADAFLAKYDSSGTLLWLKQAGGSGIDSGLFVALDSAGGVFITGVFSGNASFDGSVLGTTAGNGVFVGRYDSAGTLQWIQSADGSGRIGSVGLAVDAEGNIAITGSFSGSAEFLGNRLTSFGSDDVFIVKYHGRNGAVLWAKNAGGSGYDSGEAIAADTAGNIFVTGQFSGTANFENLTLTSLGGEDAFVAKFGRSGNLLWASQGRGSETDTVDGMDVDAAGNCFIAGTFSAPIEFGPLSLTSRGVSDGFLVKFDKDGSPLWARSVGGTSRDSGSPVAVDDSGNSHFSGVFAGTAFFGDTTLQSRGAFDIFVARYDAQGRFAWVISAGGSDSDIVQGMDVDSLGNIYLTGSFSDIATFGTNQLRTIGTEDIFVAKLIQRELPVNRPPVLDPISSQSVLEETELSFTATATDPDDPLQALTFRLEPSAPLGATIDPMTGVFRWTPTTAQGPMNYSVTIRVTDDGSPPLSDTKSFNVTVTAPLPPAITAIPDQTGRPETPTFIRFVISDPDTAADKLSVMTQSDNPALLPNERVFLSGNGPERTLALVPNSGQSGAALITLVVTDTTGLTASTAFRLVVEAVNRPPEIERIDSQTVDEGTPLVFAVSARDVDLPQQSLTFALSASAPEGAAIDENNGLFVWSPTEAQAPGAYCINVRVLDNGSPPLSAMRDFVITVNEVNSAPILEPIPRQISVAGVSLTLQALARDMDLPSNLLRFSLVGVAPSGAVIDPLSGRFTWTPPPSQFVTTNVFTFQVADNGTPSLSSTQSVQVVVIASNHDPVSPALPDQSVSEGNTLAVAIPAQDTDTPANALTYRLLTDAPVGAIIDPTSGEFRWTPTEAQGPSTNTILIVITDDGIPPIAVTNQLRVIVSEANQPPTLARIADQFIDEGQTLIVLAVANDTDIPPNTLTFSLESNAPIGMTIDPHSGLLTWTPDESQGPSTNVIPVVVTDDGVPSLSATNWIRIVVSEVNRPPTFAPVSDQFIDEGPTLTVLAVANDTDLPSNSLTFGLEPGAPIGMRIDPSSGLLTWTPDESQGPSTNLISVVVMDNGAPPLADTNRFRIIVKEVNNPPLLRSIPTQSIEEGQTLALDLEASDPDFPANKLTFSLDSQTPPGMAVNPNSGVVTWTPAVGGGQRTNVIAVIVTDNGTPAMSASQTFTVAVNPKSPPSLPTIVVTSPQDRVRIEPNSRIPIAATVAAAGRTITEVRFYAGSELLDVDRTSPYEIAWDDVTPGTYSLTAKAIDDQGTIADSKPVMVVVSPFVGRVAIIQNFAHAEIERLEDDLFDLGLESQVFNRDALSAADFARFDLVIWNDLAAPGLTEALVVLLKTVFDSGKPLYLIGEFLLASGASLSSDARKLWTELMHLSPALESKVQGLIQLDHGNPHPILDEGRAGTVAGFDYPNSLSSATQAGSQGEIVLGRMESSDVLLAYEQQGSGVRSVTQAFQSQIGTNSTSLAERQKLFVNAVWWLLQRGRGLVDLSVAVEISTNRLSVGETYTLAATVQHQGELPAFGTRLVMTLPRGLEYVRHESEYGTVSVADSAVTFHLGFFNSAQQKRITVELMPTSEGIFTNCVQVFNGGDEVTVENNLACAPAVIVVSTGQKAQRTLIVDLVSNGEILFRSLGSLGQPYTIEFSNDLTNWMPLTNYVATTVPFMFRTSTSDTQRFYRTVTSRPTTFPP